MDTKIFLKRSSFHSICFKPITYMYNVHVQYQGLTKVPSGCQGEVDFPVGQVTFHSHLPKGQEPRQVICQLNCKKGNLRLAQGKQNLRATCPKGKLEFK